MELNAHKWLIKQKLKQFVQKCKQALWFLTRDNPRRRQFVALPLWIQWIVFARSGIAAAWNGSIHPASSGPKVSPRVFEFAALLLLLSILLHCWRRRLLLLVAVADVICQTCRSDASDAGTSAGTRTGPMLIAPISVDRWVIQRVHWLPSSRLLYFINLKFLFIHLKLNNFLKIFDFLWRNSLNYVTHQIYARQAHSLGPWYDRMVPSWMECE